MRQKTRLLSLRLSDEEYAALRNLSSERNSPNISAVARLAIQRLVTGEATAPTGDLEFRLEELKGRVTLLGRQVQHLYRLLEQKRPDLVPEDEEAAPHNG